MAFSERGSLLQAPPNLYKVLLAFSQPLVAYVVVGIPTTPPVLVRSGLWSSVSGLPADKISEIDQPAGLSYRHGPTDLFSIGASSSATRFYLTKPRARPRREFALPNPLFDNKAESPDPTFMSFE
uniref:Uncharacterized protein n=1 Tax=Vitis vinifera TaxID=29760 RepID=A5BK68_VITVI|nr:hypothetical protein VITISV_029800 [Vitis vinifera]